MRYPKVVIFVMSGIKFWGFNMFQSTIHEIFGWNPMICSDNPNVAPHITPPLAPMRNFFRISAGRVLQLGPGGGGGNAQPKGLEKVRSRHILREIVSLLRRTSLPLDFVDQYGQWMTRKNDLKKKKHDVPMGMQMLEKLMTYGIYVDDIELSINLYLCVCDYWEILVGSGWLTSHFWSMLFQASEFYWVKHSNIGLHLKLWTGGPSTNKLIHMMVNATFINMDSHVGLYTYMVYMYVY